MFAPVAYVQVRLPELSNISYKQTLSIAQGFFVGFRRIFKMIKAVIFDLDGTLVNSLEDLATSTNYALNKYGFPTHETEKYKYFVGDGMIKLMERVLPEQNRDDVTVNRLFESFFKFYSEHYLDKTVAYDGIHNVLDTLKKDGVKIAVVSNKKDDMAQIVVEKIFGNVFDFVVGKREGYPTKPDPKLTLEVIDILGVTPKECAFVGDSGMDMAAAKNSGCLAVGVLWGFRTADELNNNGADYLLENTSGIAELIKEINNGSNS